MNNAHVHPLIAAALAGFDAKPITTRVQTRAAYLNDLKSHDWEYQFADDHRAYERGRDSLANLKACQPVLDPNGAIWDSVAPQGHKLLIGRAAA